jgi:hypothetical protein
MHYGEGLLKVIGYVGCSFVFGYGVGSLILLI